MPTRDPSDRAHGLKDADGYLLPGARVQSARPRCYPPSSMTSAGVAHDSAFDATYLAQKRLRGVSGLGAGSVRTVAQAVHHALARLNGKRVTA